MLITGSVVAFVFRLINLAALIAVLVYLVRKYGLPELNKALAEQEQAVTDIKQQTQDLHTHAHKLDADLSAQEQLANELIRKVHAWKTQFEAQTVQHEQERERLIESAHQKAAIQQQTIRQLHLQNKVLPVAIEHAQKTLEQQFSSDQAGKQYIKSVINALERSSS